MSSIKIANPTKKTQQVCDVFLCVVVVDDDEASLLSSRGGAQYSPTTDQHSWAKGGRRVGSGYADVHIPTPQRHLCDWWGWWD
jgi:hypothetical protein